MKSNCMLDRIGRLLSRFFPRDRVESWMGDLEEELGERGVTWSEARRRLWCVKETLSIVLHQLGDRIPTGWSRPAKEDLVFDVFQDLLHGSRVLLRSRGFAAFAILTLAAGIGATTAVFSLVHGVLLRPLPYPDPERLVFVAQEKIAERELEPVSPPNFFDLRRDTRSLTGLAGYWSPRLTLTGGGEPEQILAATVSYDLFEVLGVEPVLGRTFREEEDAPGAERVVVLSHGFWQRRHGGDPRIVGATISLDGNPCVVVGVMPRGFSFPAPGTELWVPLRLPRSAITGDPTEYRQFRILNVIARLAPDVSLGDAKAELAAVGTRLAGQHPEANRGYAIAVESLHEHMVGGFRTALVVLLASMSTVLLVGCINIGCLLLARSLARGKEMAIRTALGAGRARLLRQLLAEYAILAVSGAAIGLVLAALGLELFLDRVPGEIPRVESISLDPAAFVFALLLSVLATLSFGLIPALVAARADLFVLLRAAGRWGAGPGSLRLRSGLVSLQVALAIVLLVAAGLLMKSFLELRSVDPGLRTENVLTVARIELSAKKYARREQRAAFFEALLARMRALPGVESASVSLGLPLGPDAEFFVDRTPFSIENRAPFSLSARPLTRLHVVSPDFFATLGIPVLRGRGFEPAGRPERAPVAVINETMARRFWPGEDPIGKRITHDLQLLPECPTTREIVGVSGDVRHFGLGAEIEPQMYVPLDQCPWPQMHLLVRTESDPSTLARAIRQEVWELDADVPVPEIDELEDVASASVALPRFRARLLSLFAASTLLLAAVGVYGVIAYVVSQRSFEIGVRMAIGASEAQILKQFLWEGLRPVLAGAVLGIAAALTISRVLTSLLFQVRPHDAAVFITVTLVVIGVGLASAYLPARRAARVDPVCALRAE